MVYSESDKFKEAVLEEFNKYEKNNMNIILKRTVPYDSNGRFQTEDEAKNIDDKIKNTLDESEIPYMIINGNVDGYKEILDIVLEKLNKRK